MQMFRISVLLSAWLASIRLALAHPGHGGPEGLGYLFHYLVQPAHSIPLVLVSLGALVLVRRRRSQAMRSCR